MGERSRTLNNDKKRRLLRESLAKDYTTQIRWVADALEKITEPVDLSDLYKRVDTLLKKTGVNKLSHCTPSCSHCCTGKTVMTYAEALHIQNKGISNITPTRKISKAGSCTFLDAKTNKCGIYMDRPLACRARFQVDSVDNCISSPPSYSLDLNRSPATGQVSALLAQYIVSEHMVGVAQINQWFSVKNS